MLEGKKGISPLIATLLLILFSIALGAVVMTWGRSYVEGAAQYAQTNQQSQVSCAFDASIGIRAVGGKPSVCYDGAKIKMLVENTGVAEVKGASAQIIGKGNEVTKSELPNLDLKRADVQEVSVDYSGTPAQVQITPNYYSNNQMVCPKNVLIIENIKQC